MHTSGQGNLEIDHYLLDVTKVVLPASFLAIVKKRQKSPTRGPLTLVNVDRITPEDHSHDVARIALAVRARERTTTQRAALKYFLK